MDDLTLIKKDYFEKMQCDFYCDESDNIFMTSEQLGRVLGYSNPSKAISTVVERNRYLENKEFSSFLSLRSEAGVRNTRVFTEDGVYEVTMISRTDRAQRFRAWVRKVIKAIRSGQLKLDSYMIDDPIDRAKAWIGEQEEQRRLLAAKDETIAHKNEEISDLQETSGLTALQVMQAVNALKGRLSAITGKQFYSGMSQFQSEKDKVFRRFGVSLWEQIPKYKFDDLIKFIQGI